MQYIYYFHNGIGIGYILVALALLEYEKLLRKQSEGKILSILKILIFVWIAIGCYESFMLVFIIGVLLTVLFYGITNRKILNFKFMVMNLFIGIFVVVGSMILRAIIVPIIIAVFQIGGHDELMSARSLTGLFSLFSTEGIQTLIMLIKRYLVVFHINAFVYLPITGYNIACIILGIYTLIQSIRKKNFWYLTLFFGIVIAPFLLTIIDTKIPFYRTCQHIPFLTAVGFMLLYIAFYNFNFVKKWNNLIIFISIVFVFNQATQLNKSFYDDYREYNHEKEILIEVVEEVWSQYGDEVPIYITGSYDIPFEFIEDYYISYDSTQYKIISSITDIIDVHLKEKYYQPQGYCFIGERNLPMIRWGFDAFDGTNGQLIEFLRLHGYSITTITEEEKINEARSIGANMEEWPKKGSIIMHDGYVIVNL